MRLKSRGLGRKELVMDFREYTVVREGSEVVIKGTITEPVHWDFSIRMCEDDIAGISRVALQKNMLSFLVKALFKRNKDDHWTGGKEAHMAAAKAAREEAEKKAEQADEKAASKSGRAGRTATAEAAGSDDGDDGVGDAETETAKPGRSTSRDRSTARDRSTGSTARDRSTGSTARDRATGRDRSTAPSTNGTNGSAGSPAPAGRSVSFARKAEHPAPEQRAESAADATSGEPAAAAEPTTTEPTTTESTTTEPTTTESATTEPTTTESATTTESTAARSETAGAVQGTEGTA